MKAIKHDVFDLSDYEEQALSFLAIMPEPETSLAHIAWCTKIPRTSTKRTLASLLERGLVETVPKGKREFWTRTNTTAVTRDVLQNVKMLGIDIGKLSAPGITIVHGRKKMSDAVLAFMQGIPNGGQLNGVQPTQSAATSIQKIGVDTVAQINEVIKRKRIIVRGVLGATYPETLYRKFGEKWLKSFIPRIAHFVTVPETYLNYDAELHLTSNRALIANWTEEVAILIDNTHVITLLTSLYKFMHDRGERINQDKFTSLLKQDTQGK